MDKMNGIELQNIVKPSHLSKSQKSMFMYRIIHPAIENTAKIWTQNSTAAASFPQPLKLATAPVNK